MIQASNASATVQNDPERTRRLTADAFVAACGCYAAALRRSVGVDLPIDPGKGYSATFKLLRPDAAPMVSMIDDHVKCAMSRLGEHLPVAGTIELGGYDTRLKTPLARARWALLARRVEEVLPGVCDTRLQADGGAPHLWTGLRPAMPNSIAYMGQTPVGKPWVNVGHGMLGWTHGAGSGKTIAELICGEKPAMDFSFLRGLSEVLGRFGAPTAGCGGVLPATIRQKRYSLLHCNIFSLGRAHPARPDEQGTPL